MANHGTATRNLHPRKKVTKSFSTDNAMAVKRKAFCEPCFLMEDFPGWCSTKEETSAETGQHSSSANIKENLPLSWRSKWGNEKSKPQREPEISACRNQPCVLGGLSPNLGRKTWNPTVLAGPLRNQKLHATASRAETLGVSGRCHFSKLRDAGENQIPLFLLRQQFEENVQGRTPEFEPSIQWSNTMQEYVSTTQKFICGPYSPIRNPSNPLKLRRWLIRPALKCGIISETQCWRWWKCQQGYGGNGTKSSSNGSLWGNLNFQV